MAIRKIPISSGTAETGIIFYSSGGHDHNGISSSLIDTTQYSTFDFNPGFVSNDSNRRQRQQTNFQSFQSFILTTINESVITPVGINIPEGTITAKEIAAGSITSNQLSSNIILVNNKITSSNWDGVIQSNGAISNIGTVGWAITSAGEAVFDSSKIRGSIAANSLLTPSLTIASNGAITTTSGFFGVTNGGYLTATNANITGAINASSGTITGYLTAGGVDIGVMRPSSPYYKGINLSPDPATQFQSCFIKGSGNEVYFRADNGSQWIKFENGSVQINAVGFSLDGTNASFSGSITAASGTIAGFSIDSLGLYKSVDGNTTRLSSVDSSLNLYGLYDDVYADASIYPGQVRVYATNGGGSTTITGYRIYTRGTDSAVAGYIYTGTVFADYVTSHQFDSSGGIKFPNVHSTRPNMPTQNWRINLQFQNPNSMYVMANDDNGSVHVWSTSTVSDRRTKDNIIPNITNYLEKFYSLSMYEFEYNKNRPWTGSEFIPTGEKEIGLIADEVEPLFPNTILGDAEVGYQQINYQEFCKILIGASLDQNKRILDLESRLKALEEV